MYQIQFTDSKVKKPTKIIGIGLNYTDHIKEMKSKRAANPVIFIKPSSSLCDFGKPIPIFREYGSVHHEIELAVCISKTCARITEQDAVKYIAGYGMALDLTLRDMQTKAKQIGHPWAIAKGFDYACPVSRFVPAKQIEDPQKLNLRLSINSVLRQQGNTGQMIYRIPELVAYISKFFTLEDGDLILTGTPAGVGELNPGDQIHAELEGIASIKTTVIDHK